MDKHGLPLLHPRGVAYIDKVGGQTFRYHTWKDRPVQPLRQVPSPTAANRPDVTRMPDYFNVDQSAADDVADDEGGRVRPVTGEEEPALETGGIEGEEGPIKGGCARKSGAPQADSPPELPTRL